MYDKSVDIDLPAEIESMYPDYSLYPEFTKDTAYGFLTRGCPRGCDFCHVACKEGRISHKVADAENFWKGQKFIKLSDPNILACKDWRDLLDQLEKTKAYVDFNQGLDVRLATEEKIEELNKIRMFGHWHLAWDRCEQDLTEDFKRWQKHFKRKSGTTVFVLTNFNSTIEEDLYRIYTLIDLKLDPYVMTYDSDHADDIHLDLERWIDGKFFRTVKKFEDYKGRRNR